jgi:2-methylcitrate dehydratase PrpD
MAAMGMSAAADAIEHPQGLLMATSPNGNVNLARPVETGRTWRILSHGLNIKRYPTCYSATRGVDGIRALMEQHAFRAHDVAALTVTMSRRNATILRHHRPNTALEAKFSMEFAAAAALTTGSLSLSELRDEFVRRPDIQALMEKVTVVPVDQEDLATGYAPSDTISIRMKSGIVFDTQMSRIPRVSAEAVFDKFEACLKIGGFTSPAREFHDALTALDQSLPARQLVGRWL